MPNEYMWAQTSGNFPDIPKDSHYGGGGNNNNNGGFETQQQSAQAPRNYQADSHSSYSGGAQYSSPSRSSSYTHQQSPDAGSYTHQQQQPQYQQQQQQQQHQSERQQYGGSRSSSYQIGNGNGSHGASNGDQVEQSVDLDDLIRENFGGQGGHSSTVQLVTELREQLSRVTPRGRDSKLYFLEPQSGGQSASGMIYPTSDIKLANQLAVKHHRHACMRNLGSSVGPDLNEKVRNGTQWSMLDDERLELVTSVSTGNGQKMTFSTTVQELALFRCK